MRGRRGPLRLASTGQPDGHTPGRKPPGLWASCRGSARPRPTPAGPGATPAGRAETDAVAIQFPSILTPPPTHALLKPPKRMPVLAMVRQASR